MVAHAQDLSQPNLDPHKNKQLTRLADVAEGRPEDHRPEAGWSLGGPRDRNTGQRQPGAWAVLGIFLLLLTLLFYFKRGKLGEEDKHPFHMYINATCTPHSLL